MLIYPAIDLFQGKAVRLFKGDYACQFHPEKSGTVGLNILKAFAQLEDAPC